LNFRPVVKHLAEVEELTRPDRYDDGGLSGASLDRPALQNLLADVGAGRITIVVVYKVDRLTRSLADFAKLVELFDQHGISFVSITQSFNTTSSMGRLTLNVLLSFAQFEREVIGERVRDKIAASKRKGLWVGGPVPLGYRCLDKKLEIVREEAEVVRAIFSWYLDLGSMGALIAELDRQGIRTKLNGRRDGRRSGGIRFGVGPLPICSKTGSTSARSPIAARCIAASTNRSSAETCSRPCRRSAPPTPLTGGSGLEAQPLYSPAGSSTTAATG
jgi:DNA invertase Pin-like site-specific DNA recombinase